ncbi:UNVERIFIED_CONTAM: hypothetical protein HDU68_004766 [Siphonaria sp. JEL0065]|nr:hypothetical protein HDU68_004766 [Siphonaria sp. JEL0065]
MSTNHTNNNGSELETNFRTAALAVTNLYRTAQAEKLAAFDDGYASCFDDLLTFLTTTSSPPPTTPGAPSAPSDSTHFIDSLVSFFSAKQDVLNPAAAESLHNLVSSFKPQQPTHHHQNFEQHKEPPVFTFTATPQTSIASEFHKSHPILPFAARHRVFGLRPAGGSGSVSGGGGIGGGALLGGRRRGYYNNGLSINSHYGGSNDLSAVFSGVDFSALGLGPISLSSSGGGAAVAAEGLSARDASTPPTDSSDNKERRSSSCLFDSSRGLAIPSASNPPPAAVTTLKRRWNGQTVSIDEMNQQQQQASESYHEQEGDDHLMFDDSEMNAKRVRWNSMTD